MTKLGDRTDIPTLDGGWVNLTEAAALLGYSRSYMYKLAAKAPSEGGFSTLHKIGSQASYVVNQQEISSILAERPPVEEVVLSLAELQK
jgi:predicted DNA-binding transcriptional regulator AlpA